MFYLTKGLITMRTNLFSLPTVGFLGVCLLSVGRGLELNTAVRRSRPGLKSPPKLWWAKEITPDFHVSGRPTERQIKYAYEGGFKSIFSLFEYNTPGNHGGDYLPTTVEAEKLATSLGLAYKSLIENQDEFWTVETIQAFSNAIQDLPRPILLHCNRGYTISYVTLMYMANKTRHDPGFEPKIYSNNFYRIVAAMGLDFMNDNLKDVVSLITGEEFVRDPPTPDAIPANWRNWWLAHPVAKNWFAAGQIRRSDVRVLEKAGFKSVVNLRLGNTYKGKPSQEPVTLLNVNDNTATYGDGKTPARQSDAMLQQSRINPELGPDYIAADSDVNYERRNAEEFGDEVGYNEEIEREFFLRYALAYYHLPINVDEEYTVDQFNEIRDTLLEAGRKGPVILHCRLGKRVAYIGPLIAAIQEGYSLEWALNRLTELGYEASPQVRPDFYNLYRAVLSSEDQHSREEL